MDIENKILEIINTGINKDGFLEIDRDTTLNNGIIDSLDIMHLINDLEHAFSISIYEGGLVKEDFENIHAMAKLVEKKLQEK